MIPDVIALLEQLIQIPSVNPDNSPGTDPCGEHELAVFLTGWLEAIGAEVTLEEVQPGRPNLIARFAPRDGRPRILLGPHLDTVGISGMSIPPFAGEFRDGKIWGRGACDTKGPMAAMLWALQAEHPRLADLPVAVDFVAFMGEESGQWGSKDFVQRHGHDYTFAIVGEPTGLQIVHLTKGSLWAVLSASGRAAHSSQPERGDNAILKLIRALDRLDCHLGAQLETYQHPVLGRSTLNIGVIQGGTRPNIVPDSAHAELDIRFTPSLANAGGAIQLLKETIACHDLPVTLERVHENAPMETASDHPMILELLATAPGIRLVGAPWFSDAAHLSRGGIPSICLGPGSIDQAHTADEWIDATELQRGAEFFRSFLRRLAR